MTSMVQWTHLVVALDMGKRFSIIGYGIFNTAQGAAMKSRAFRGYKLVHRDKALLEAEACGNHCLPYFL